MEHLKHYMQLAFIPCRSTSRNNKNNFDLGESGSREGIHLLQVLSPIHQ